MKKLKIKIPKDKYVEVNGAIYLAQQPKRVDYCDSCVARFTHRSKDDGGALCDILQRSCLDKNGNHQYIFIAASVLKSSSWKKKLRHGASRA